MDKNRRVKINKININGNEFVSDRKLKRKMKNTKENPWYSIFTTSKYMEDNFLEDKGKMLRSIYKGRRPSRICDHNGSLCGLFSGPSALSEVQDWNCYVTDGVGEMQRRWRLFISRSSRGPNTRSRLVYTKWVLSDDFEGEARSDLP